MQNGMKVADSTHETRRDHGEFATFSTPWAWPARVPGTARDPSRGTHRDNHKDSWLESLMHSPTATSADAARSRPLHGERPTRRGGARPRARENPTWPCLPLPRRRHRARAGGRKALPGTPRGRGEDRALLTPWRGAISAGVKRGAPFVHLLGAPPRPFQGHFPARLPPHHCKTHDWRRVGGAGGHLERSAAPGAACVAVHLAAARRRTGEGGTIRVGDRDDYRQISAGLRTFCAYLVGPTTEPLPGAMNSAVHPLLEPSSGRAGPRDRCRAQELCPGALCGGARGARDLPGKINNTSTLPKNASCTLYKNRSGPRRTRQFRGPRPARAAQGGPEGAESATAALEQGATLWPSASLHGPKDTQNTHTRVPGSPIF